MKKILSFLLILSLGCAFTFSQEDEHAKREKMFREVREFKMKYLAQEMDLSDSQKKEFFELYENMNKSKQECYHEAMELNRKIKHDKNASDEDYQKATEALDKANAQWSEIEKGYNEKFAEFLSAKQIYKMREAENSFKAKLDEMKRSRKKDFHKHQDKKK
ncbi:MAG: hypothetical protein J1F38_00060 [Muribaculaceae bacterium]|nr:hypothetical protein [Muribaculaceae bacterium]